MDKTIHTDGSLFLYNNKERPFINQLLLAMKLFLILLAISLQVSAAALSQEITLSVQKAPLREVMQSIRKQSGYQFIIESSYLDIAKPVSVDLRSVPIEEALEKVFAEQPFGYVVKNRTVVVSKKKEQHDDLLASVEINLQIDLHGTVADSAGNPLMSATVKVKEQREKIAVTNQNGEFFLHGIPNTGTLIVSMIGFKTEEIAYNISTVIKVRLKPTLSNLDEIKVIAYGTTTNRIGTSNISSVKANVIAQQPVSNPILALQGRVPGVYIEQSAGAPGGNVKVRIQGTNSIRNGNNPLYVIDGVPFTSSLLPSVSSVLGPNGITNGPGSPLNFINPSDIESVSVLKDADATAIYGSRAANGAIIITTKKGASGETKVYFNMLSGWAKVAKKIKLLNTQDYLAIRKEAFVNDAINLNGPPYDADIYKALIYPDLSLFDQNKYTDWQKELIGNTAQYRDVQAAVSGGSNSTQFSFSTGYHRETTVFPGDLSDTKGTIGLKLNHLSPNQKFHVEFSANYMEDKNRLINMDLTSLALNTPPNAPSMYKADGSINWQPSSTGISSFIDNPARYLDLKFQNKSTNLLSNLVTSYNIAPGLTLKSSFGYNKLQSSEHRITPLSSIPPEYATRISMIDDANKYIESWIAEPQINYTCSNSLGNFDFLVGMTFQKNASDLTAINGSGFDSDADLNNIAAAPTVAITNRLASSYNYNAIFSRLTYNWQDKYILNFTARRDGSSRFGEQNLFQNFYSVGGAWVFTQESCIKKFLSFIDFGKVRVSYGTTGNDQIGDYQFLSLYSPLLYQMPYQGLTGIIPISHASPYIQWEETKKFNSGLDMAFLGNKIDLTVNYYRNRSANQLLPYALPSITGFTTVLKNIPAIVQNSGIEVQINYHLPRRNGFNWETGLNATLPQNKLIAFPALSSSTYANLLIIGRPMTITKLFDFAGVNPQTGLYEFLTAKGEKSSTPASNTDKTMWVNTEPTLFAGWSNSFNFNGLALDFLLQFVQQKGMNYKFGNLPGIKSNQPEEIVNRWQSPGDNSEIQKVNTDLSVFTQYDDANKSTAAYTDASFLRLKNVSLSYALPLPIVRKLEMSDAKIYVLGQNLFTITQFDGMDPENRSISSLPPLRVISIGFQCIF